MPQVPLHQVAEYGFLLVLNALLDRNVDLNFANENGDTGLVVHEFLFLLLTGRRLFDPNDVYMDWTN